MQKERSQPLRFPTATLPLCLNAQEVMFLIDAIGNSDMQAGMEDPEAKVAIGRRGILILASLFDEMVFLDKLVDYDITFMVDEELVWLFRSKVTTSTRSGQGTMIGIPLLKKLYKLLLNFHSPVLDLEIEPLPLIWPKEYEYAPDSTGTSPDAHFQPNH